MTEHKVYWTKYSNLKMTSHPLFQTTSTCQIKNRRLYIYIFFFSLLVKCVNNFASTAYSFSCLYWIGLKPNPGRYYEATSTNPRYFLSLKDNSHSATNLCQRWSQLLLNIDIVVATVFSVVGVFLGFFFLLYCNKSSHHKQRKNSIITLRICLCWHDFYVLLHQKDSKNYFRIWVPP